MAKSGQLSSATITAALRRGDPIQLNDGGGLSLKITGKNRGTWYYRGRSATTGKPCLVTIGHIVS